MSVATSTALIIAGGAAAGASIYGAKKQADAAKQASQQQMQAAQEARQYIEPLYERARQYAEPLYGQALQIAQQQNELGRAGLQPFASAGTSGMTALSSLLGLPAQAGVGTSAMAAPVNRAGMPPPSAMGNLAQGALAAFGPGIPRSVPPDQARAMLEARGFSGGGTGTTSPTVMLRAPNGQTQAVPADHVDFYLARGAQRV